MIGMTNASQGMDIGVWLAGNITKQVNVYSNNFTGTNPPYTQTIKFGEGSLLDDDLKTITSNSTPIISVYVPLTVYKDIGGTWTLVAVDETVIGDYEKEYGYISKIETGGTGNNDGFITVTCLKKKPTKFQYITLNIKKGGQ